HRHTLKRGRVSRAALQRAAASWWGGDPRWYPDATSPRRHNRVTPLVDGERYFHELYGALASARHYVYIAGWCLTPDLPLRRAERQELVETRLVTLLRQVARRVPVRILLWGGAVAVIHPTRRETATVARAFADQADGDLVCRLDHTARFSHCHHQKAIVIDGRVAFVGGMDLTTFQGDRWDRSGHPLRSGPNWHDLQFRLEGEIVADVEQNFLQRWRDSCRNCYPEAVPELLPQRPPCFDPAWQTPAQIVRTIPHDTYASVRRGEFGIYHSYLEAFRRARRFIYIENQYLWSPQVMDALIEQVQRRRSEPFRIVIVLPAGAHSGKWDNDRHVKQLRAADGGRGIVSIYSLYASGPSAGVHAFRYRPVYVHAKLAIVDDEWLSAGSANLNNRGLVTDSEINVVISERETARHLRLDLWAEHLAVPREQIAQGDPITLIDQLWRDRAAENAAIQRHEDRGDRPLVCAVHRYDTGRLPASWFLDEAEALTFEH
ncbi:MAG TPA: phosphatidylserine/phosphatidylglycerophosphate/cardiolipin synthase family protein, partial [Dehalococcoidia bacterium]|nr:phosphatidylserine/phosphatidylglycerophosphate/cardiolipin synthase family protein [Dehalococcoidia bacterium]